MGQTNVRLNISAYGSVQGVGFRPRVKRLADALGLHGWICNQGDHVAMMVVGGAEAVSHLQQQLAMMADRVECRTLAEQDVADDQGFRILPGQAIVAAGLCQMPADRGLCVACLAEFNDPASRRFHYPFISCHDCGPRFSILRRLPFARDNTAFAYWQPCVRCREEFADPDARRFHSELISCPDCGPRLSLWTAAGQVEEDSEHLLQRARKCLQRGGILALKSQSGMQLLVRADDEKAVQRLRKAKHRPAKPLALLVKDIAMAETVATPQAADISLLQSPQRPIVLLPKPDQSTTTLAPSLAPGMPDLGLMLPATALQFRLVSELAVPLVCTSANRSGEPLLFLNKDLLPLLGELCDMALLHDIAIEMPQDDSVVMLNRGDTLMLRRARGYCHQTVPVPVQDSVEAWGGDLKNSFALARASSAVLAPYVGDLETVAVQERQAFLRRRYGELHGFIPSLRVTDAHPGYLSHQLARLEEEAPVQDCQHHLAHLLANHAVCELPSRYLALVWDGNGYGADGTLWGSECFLVEAQRVRPAAALESFPLPGGTRALQQPWRMVLALGCVAGIESVSLAAHLVQGGIPLPQQDGVMQLLKNNINCPSSRALGRMFDAVASLLVDCHENRFEGDAAMQLQGLAQNGGNSAHGIFTIENRFCSGAIAGHWQAGWRRLLAAWEDGYSPADLALDFHQGLAAWALKLARHFDVDTLSVSGGCFQNRLLQSLLREQCEQVGIRVVCPATIPVNDGGIALGQLLVNELEWDATQ